jgi:hypothetical protein
MEGFFSYGNETLWWNIKPSPKGGGFLFVGIGNGTSLTGEILSGKGVYDTFIMLRKSRQNKHGRQMREVWIFFYVSGCR